MKKNQFTNQELLDMTMDLLMLRLAEESPHLSNPSHGQGSLDIVFGFNSAPRVCDRYSIINKNDGELKISFPAKAFDEVCLKHNIKHLYYIVSQYLSTRIVPQGRLMVEFTNGMVTACYVNNEGTYNDLQRNGKPKYNLDDFLFDDEEDEV